MNTVSTPKYITFEGKTFIKGLHGVPRYHIDKGTAYDDWYWLAGSEKKDNHFLYKTILNNLQKHNYEDLSSDRLDNLFK